VCGGDVRIYCDAWWDVRVQKWIPEGDIQDYSWCEHCDSDMGKRGWNFVQFDQWYLFEEDEE